MELLELRNFAIVFIYAALFGTAAIDKFKTFSTPDWFLKQFQKTFFAKFPVGIRLSYWVIACLEASLTVSFLLSAFHPALLPFALLGSLFLFGILLIGLRLSYDYQGSANMFVYFSASLLALFLVSH